MKKMLTLSESIYDSRKVIMETITRLNDESFSLMTQRKQKIEENPRYLETEEYGQSISASYRIIRTMKDLQDAYDTLGNILRSIK